MLTIYKSYDKTAKNNYHFSDLEPGDIFTTSDPMKVNNTPIFVRIVCMGGDGQPNAICLKDWSPITIVSDAIVWKYFGDANIHLNMHHFYKEYQDE